MLQLRRHPIPVLVLALVATLGACRLGMKLLPERYAVNAPIAQLLFGRGVDVAPDDEIRRTLQVPAGFSIATWADGLPNARFLRFTEAGDLMVSTPRSGRVWLLERDADGDGRADAARPLLEQLDRPHGIDLHEGWLYVAEASAIRRVRYDAKERRTSGALEAIVTGLPEGGNHWTRTVRFGPDGWLYVSVGSSCNACIEHDARRAAMLRFRPDGSGEEIYATGLRNSVGFDWRPDTGDLYATDNGRDLLGDDIPPCELNRVVKDGFYGWPFAWGDRRQDPDLGTGHASEVAASIAPVHAFRAHNAPLGITFVRNANPPEPLRGAALVALHGSWNRTTKDGYRVVSLHWLPDGRIDERDFVSGFVRGDGRAIGRPVDVAEGPDGAFYVSDDYAGAIYRVSAGPAAHATATPPRASTGAPRGDPLAALAVSDRNGARARGRAVYEGNACYRCHESARADAGVVPVVFAGLAAKYDVDSLATYLAAPQPPMPLVPLEPAARRDVAAFLLLEHGQ